LREGFSSLRRAHAVLLTRCELVEQSGGRARLNELRASIRSFNPDAPCFIVRTALRGFPVYGEEPPLDSRELPPQSAFAFCALGNHQSFFKLLSGAGLSLAGKLAFADHHRYNQEDIDAISKRAAEARAACLITTEKDVVNLPPRAVFPLLLRWAAIEPEIENADALIGWILGKLPTLARSAASARGKLASSGRDRTPAEETERRDSAEHDAPPLAK
jgi:tetraacyldisaccharide 4'-kinase